MKRGALQPVGSDVVTVYDVDQSDPQVLRRYEEVDQAFGAEVGRRVEAVQRTLEQARAYRWTPGSTVSYTNHQLEAMSS